MKQTRVSSILSCRVVDLCLSNLTIWAYCTSFKILTIVSFFYFWRLNLSFLFF